MASFTRYTRNRHLWRKVYGFRRRRPRRKQFFDTVENVSYSLDINQTIRHRDPFVLNKKISASFVAPPPVVAEYDEDFVTFNNTDTEITAFNFCFSQTPDAVVLNVEPTGDNTDNIIVHGISFTSCSMSVGVSAPFSGNIRYRAAFSNKGYPANATDINGNDIRISAGKTTLSQQTSYNVSFDKLNDTPSSFFESPWDFFSNFDSDVNTTVEASSSNSAQGEISAPLSNEIYFIAIE